MLLGLEVVQMTSPLEGENQQTLANVQAGGKTLLRMIGEILEVSKAEAGQLQLDRSATCPRKLIEDACAPAAALAANAGVRLQWQVAPDAPVLQADGDKLRRVLVNLISNAIQQSPAGGTVTIQAYQDPLQNSVIFEVADHGCGLAQEDCGSIFEKYGQTGLRKTGKVSTGLGLPFCKLAVEAHGGRISVKSILEKGTVFRFSIPAEIGKVPETMAAGL
jgi:signal transduction histidine kinase